MCVHIDEAGGKHPAVRVDDLRCIDPKVAADRDDAAVIDDNVADEPGTAGAIHDPGVTDHEVGVRGERRGEWHGHYGQARQDAEKSLHAIDLPGISGKYVFFSSRGKCSPGGRSMSPAPAW